MKSRANVFLCSFAMSLVLGFSQALALNCDSTQVISVDYTLPDDITTDNASDPCFEVDTDGVTLNLGGNAIICETASDCDSAVLVSADNVIVKNGTIKGGLGEWNIGVENGSVSGTAYDTTIRNIIVDGATTGVFAPGEMTEGCVFKNITTNCIATFLVTTPGGSKVQQNFCESDTQGFLIAGPTTGTAVDVLRNYVEASTNGINLVGKVDAERNVILGATDPILTTGTGVTTSQNACEDETDCPDPDAAAFTFNIDW